MVFLFSCARKPGGVTLHSSHKRSAEAKQNNRDSCVIQISALNLSEDMSSLSTKNDEIFVFIYDYSDTNELKAPLVSKKVVFDKKTLLSAFLYVNKIT